MAGERSNLSHTISGSSLKFYMDSNSDVRVRVCLTANAADYEIIITGAEWTALMAALSGADTSYTPTSALGPMGADFTVHT